jgi:hypothetical protein
MKNIEESPFIDFGKPTSTYSNITFNELPVQTPIKPIRQIIKNKSIKTTTSDVKLKNLNELEVQVGFGGDKVPISKILDDNKKKYLEEYNNLLPL